MDSPKDKLNSKRKNREFALVFFLFFTCLAYFSRTSIKRLSFEVAAGSLFLLGLAYPNVLNKPRIAWLYFGKVLNKFTSPVFLSIFFFLVFTPMSIFIRTLKKRESFSYGSNPPESYWVKSLGPKSNFKDQF